MSQEILFFALHCADATIWVHGWWWVDCAELIAECNFLFGGPLSVAQEKEWAFEFRMEIIEKESGTNSSMKKRGVEGRKKAVT